MKKVLISVAAAAVLATGASADIDAGCGLGYMVLGKDSKGDMPKQVLAATLNGTSGNQTFGMTTGTSGCNPSGVWASNEELNNFTSQNLEKLASDMAKGSGETLDAFAELAGVADKDAFFASSQANFSKIFTHDKITAGEVLANMDAVL